MKIYVETSAISGSLDKDEPNMRKYSNEFIKLLKKKVHEGFISTLVLEEISKAHKNKTIALKRIINKLQLKVLEIDEKVLDLSKKYIDAKLIPESYRADAIHISVASINSMDALVSWNLSHIVKLKTIKGVNEINRAEGYKMIAIVTPEMVIG